MTARPRFLTALAVCATLVAVGCSSQQMNVDPDDEDPGPAGDLGDFEAFPDFHVFDAPPWPIGGVFHTDATPAWDVPGKGGDVTAGVPVSNSNPAEGSTVPLDADEISFTGVGHMTLTSEMEATLSTELGNFGNASAAGDVAIGPSVAILAPAGEMYHVFMIRTNGVKESLDGSTPDAGRTRVVSVAFGRGSGGYVPAAPNTADPFAGALAWMKSTRNPFSSQWSMQQADWRSGSQTGYPTTARMFVRGNAAALMIRDSELETLAADRVCWDVFSYTTDPGTEWSHDTTGWLRFRAVP